MTYITFWLFQFQNLWGSWVVSHIVEEWVRIWANKSNTERMSLEFILNFSHEPWEENKNENPNIPTFYYREGIEKDKSIYKNTKSINSNNSWLGLYEAKVETTVYKVFEKKKKKARGERENLMRKMKRQREKEVRWRGCRSRTFWLGFWVFYIF